MGRLLLDPNENSSVKKSALYALAEVGGARALRILEAASARKLRGVRSQDILAAAKSVKDGIVEGAPEPKD